ncbi:MAG: zinc ribbon domain-containing protein [Thermoflexales bacterium]|nr:zinc ribbon domain-containing protein [Thermoflexales bacterium]
MTQKPLGYVELEWTCKRCGTRNPGLQKICSGCASPMSEQDQFEAPLQHELITDEAKLAQAKREASDIHCPYCGARNPAGSTTCVQCGANLQDAKAREAGRVVGAHQEAAPVSEVACPYCQTPNPPNAVKCKKCGGNLVRQAAAPAVPPAPTPMPKGLLIGLAVVLALLCLCVLGFMVMNVRTTDAPGVVEAVQWERTIAIVELRPVQREDWADEIPAGASQGSCVQKHRSTQSNPAPGAEEVCGTPYTIDQGDGTGKVVQDCEYKIYDRWCKYTANEWTVVDTLVARGADYNPVWPAVSLLSGQREGDRSEKYQVLFSADDKDYSYQLNSPADLAKFTKGSQWKLHINTFGNVNSVEPLE